MKGGITGVTRSFAGEDTPIESYLELLDKQRNRKGVLAASLACNGAVDDETYLRGCNAHLVSDPEEAKYCGYFDLNGLYAFSGNYSFCITSNPNCLPVLQCLRPRLLLLLLLLLWNGRRQEL